MHLGKFGQNNMNTFKGKKILVTGHTGFKGSWLCLFLKKMGAEITGIGLREGNTKHFEMLNLDINNYFIDINNLDLLKNIFSSNKFDLIIHMAAQPLVKYSYKKPLETFKTNIIGTANIFECSKLITNLKGVLCITSDKCYKNLESINGYSEEDQLGGSDPYSSSKSCAELIALSYRESFFKKEKKILTTARAGNVIGGGDWSKDRLIVDIMNSYNNQNLLNIRNPFAIRPWQHVFDCIYAYLLLSQKILNLDFSVSQAWNIGPLESNNKNVKEILQEIEKNIGSIEYEFKPDPNEKETNKLLLNSRKIREELSWRDLLSFEESIKLTCDWYLNYYDGNCLSEKQAEIYLSKMNL